MVGALVLAVSLIVALRAHRVRFARAGSGGDTVRGRTAVAA